MKEVITDRMKKYMPFQSNKLYPTRYSDGYLFLIIAITGFTSSLFFRTYLKSLQYQFGIEAIGLFIPPFLTGIYMVYAGLKNGFANGLLLKLVILFIIQLLPFSDLLFHIVSPNPGEDFARNLAYAKNMIANHTLWGGDRIAFTDESLSYITQPGYRYFVASELIIFRNLYRFVSVFNILLFIISIFYFFKTINEEMKNRALQLMFMVVVIMSIPYAVKNILMGLSEWLTVCLMIFVSYFYKLKTRTFLALFLLSLVPFLRQNLLPPTLLLAIWIISCSKNKLYLIIVFAIPLMLPLYHNLYYAGEWRFFISLYHWPFLNYVSPSKEFPATGVNCLLIFNNFLHYFGVHIKGSGKVDILEEAILFLISYLAFCFYVVRNIIVGYKRVWFLFISFSAIIPAIFLATDFYPRFEFMNIFITLTAFSILYSDNNLYFEKYK